MILSQEPLKTKYVLAHENSDTQNEGVRCRLSIDPIEIYQLDPRG